jgi:FAD/FMN-containing dehydrogenase
VHLGDNNKTVSVGAGARWGEVYAKLEPLDLTVAGSRTATDGVGVFVLGGGLSWYSNQHGWACDSVLEFEVVTPRGEILWVNNETHEGLFWGLKGSSGALGIVTKIKMPTITSESIYGGRLTFDEQQLPGIIEALKNLAVSAPDDPDSQGYLSITWRSSREVFYSAYLVDTANRPASPGLNAFYTIPRKTSSLRFMTIGESAEEVGDSNTHGLRRSQFTLTARLRPEVMQAVHDLVRTVAEEITFGRNDSLDMTFQPITISHLLRSYRSNVFNLDPSRGPLLLISFELSWSAPADDEYFADIARALRGTLERRLRSRKVLEDWIHPNYAAKEQSPFEGEGWKQSPNGKMLRAVARKYDPDGLWRKMVPGIWHV